MSGRYYQDIDAPHFDYRLEELAELPGLELRGPLPDLSAPYIVCLGAAQTLGRFCERPFSHQLGEALGIGVVNFGIGGTGPRFFLGSEMQAVINGAALAVVQVLSGRSASNSYFDNRRSGSLTGVRLTDYEEMRFEGCLEGIFQTESHDIRARVVEETRQDYLASFAELADAITCPRILLWLSDRSPDYEDDLDAVWTTLNRFPQLVNRDVIDLLRAHFDGYVECVSDEGLPQPLWEADEAVEGSVLSDGRLWNRYYPSPEMHDRAARGLIEAVRPFIPQKRERARKGQKAGASAMRRFVLIGAERTGSNLFMGMLDSHPACLTANELYNPANIEAGVIPTQWEEMAEDEELAKLRDKDPLAFLHAFYETAEAGGFKAAGFKLLYGHFEYSEAVSRHLLEAPEIAIIHLERRNLLRRYVSEMQACATDVWAVGPEGELPELPAITLDYKNMIWDFIDKTRHAARVNAAIEAKANGLRVLYETMARAPEGAGALGLAFLDLQRHVCEIRFRRTGAERLEDAVTNLSDIRVTLERWRQFAM